MKFINKKAIKYYFWRYLKKNKFGFSLFFFFIFLQICFSFLVHFVNKRSSLQTEEQFIQELNQKYNFVAFDHSLMTFRLLNINLIRQGFQNDNRFFITKVYGIFAKEFLFISKNDELKRRFNETKFLLNLNKDSWFTPFIRKLIFLLVVFLNSNLFIYFIRIYNLLMVAKSLFFFQNENLEENRLVILNSDFTREQIYFSKIFFSLVITFCLSILSFIFLIFNSENYSFNFFQKILFFFINFTIFPFLAIIQRINLPLLIFSKIYAMDEWNVKRSFLSFAMSFVIFLYWFILPLLIFMSDDSIKIIKVVDYWLERLEVIYFVLFVVFSFIDLSILINNYYENKKFEYSI